MVIKSVFLSNTIWPPSFFPRFYGLKLLYSWIVRIVGSASIQMSECIWRFWYLIINSFYLEATLCKHSWTSLWINLWKTFLLHTDKAIKIVLFNKKPWKVVTTNLWMIKQIHQFLISFNIQASMYIRDSSKMSSMFLWSSYIHQSFHHWIAASYNFFFLMKLR